MAQAEDPNARRSQPELVATTGYEVMEADENVETDAYLSDETIILDNFVTKVTLGAKSLDNVEVTERNNVVKVDSGVPSDTFNVIIPMSKGTENSFQELLRSVQTLQMKGFPMSIWVDDRFISCHLTSMLKTMGFQEAESNITMRKNISSNILPFETLKGTLDIRQVMSAVDVLIYSDIFKSLFGDSIESKAIGEYFNKVALIFDSSQSAVQMYIGFANGRAVSTGCIVEADHSYGIYDLITKEKERGKGYGSAMFQYLLNQLDGSKHKPCILQASPDGLGIYKKAGFESIGEMIVFEAKCRL
ncbi:hypothetical protein K7432_016033 [Basidiobolus ranarum]|uniref:N-acetyltransferase domain-containing protein n=1 Tax=Basidiobolus ranarum TaxID=34480 RepID=A0ABR2VN94_9FUNG